jgi:hypothetical protein
MQSRIPKLPIVFFQHHPAAPSQSQPVRFLQADGGHPLLNTDR